MGEKIFGKFKSLPSSPISFLSSYENSFSLPEHDMNLTYVPHPYDYRFIGDWILRKNQGIPEKDVTESVTSYEDVIIFSETAFVQK